MFTSKPDTQGLPVGHLKLHHMLDTDDPTLVDIPELPPLMLDQSFFMPVSAIRSFFQTVTRVPFYRFPKTLGWPTMDVTLEPTTPPGVPIVFEPPLVSGHPSQFLSPVRAGTYLFFQNR